MENHKKEKLSDSNFAFRTPYVSCQCGNRREMGSNLNQVFFFKQMFMICICVLLVSCAKTSDDFLKSGLVNVQNRKYDTALSDFNNAVRLDSNNARAYLERAKIACRTGFTESVRKDLSKYIELTAHNMGIAYVGRALTKRFEHDVQSTIADLDRAIFVDPNNIQGYALKEIVLIESGDTVRLREFRQGLSDHIRQRLKNYVQQDSLLN